MTENRNSFIVCKHNKIYLMHQAFPLSKQKKKLILLAALFALLVIVYFVVVVPLVESGEAGDETNPPETVDGEIIGLNEVRGLGVKYADYTAQIGFEGWIANSEIEEKHYQNQQREIARIEAYIEQQKRWNRERNIIAAESREKAIARMEKIDKPKDLPKSIRFALSSSGESGNDVAYARNLTMGFGDNILFRNLFGLICV